MIQFHNINNASFTIETLQHIILHPVVVECHHGSYVIDMFVTWELRATVTVTQVVYEYQLLGSTESELEAVVVQQMNTTATVANITLSSNYTNITFSITAHNINNCAGSSDETMHIIQVKGETLTIIQ